MPTAPIGNVIQQSLQSFGKILGLSAADPRDIVVRLARVGFGFLGTLFLVLILWSGLLIMTSGGNEEKVVQAKKTFFNAIIGLIIILSAYSIVQFALKALLPQ